MRNNTSNFQKKTKKEFNAKEVKPGTKGNTVLNGEIIEALPNTMFKVKLEDGHEVIGVPSGKMRRGFMRMLPGVQIKIEMTPYDAARGRIIARNAR